ncbi:MAG: hypothetical protein AAGB02_03900 [Pseudomonadota bacterium]
MKLIFALALAASPVNERYQDCVTLVQADLEIGRIAAQQWVGDGGGAMALHCLARADAAAGFPKLAATRLEDIAERKDAGDALERARILSQAAEAWLDAGNVHNAANANERAFALAPDSGELHIVAAKIFESKGSPLEVIKSINAAEEQDLGSAAGFVARARAYKDIGDLEASADDIVRALALDPENVKALVLRGELQQAGIVIDVNYDG